MSRHSFARRSRQEDHRRSRSNRRSSESGTVNAQLAAVLLKAIGRYSIVGPDRRFFVPSGILKRQNTLTVYVDGYGSTAAAGGVKVAPFAEQIAMSLNVTPETK